MTSTSRVAVSGAGLGARLKRAVPGDTATPSATAAALLRVLVDALGADGGALLLTDPSTMLFSGGAVSNLPAAACEPFFESEVGSSSPRAFGRSAVPGPQASALSRSPDFRRTPLYRDVLEPFGYGDELRARCVASGACWGALSLWRRVERPVFTQAHERVVDEVAPGVGALLRSSVVASMTRGASGNRRHGVIVLEGRDVIDVSPDAERLLRTYEHESWDHYRFLEYLVTRAAADPEMSLLLTADDGGWFSADAYPMSTPGRTAIVLSDAAPTHLMRTLVTGVGLTPRELEVALLICRGSSDAEIAEALQISPNTAQDHVKSIRAKLGVPRRSAIAARLFADYYFQGFLAAASIEHRGG